MSLEWKQLTKFKELPQDAYFLIFIEQEQTIFIGFRKYSSLTLYELEEIKYSMDWDGQIDFIKNIELTDDIKNGMLLEAEKGKAHDEERSINFKKINTSIIVMTEEHFKKYLIVQYIVLPSLKGPFLKPESIHGDECKNDCPCKTPLTTGKE